MNSTTTTNVCITCNSAGGNIHAVVAAAADNCSGERTALGSQGAGTVNFNIFCRNIGCEECQILQYSRGTITGVIRIKNIFLPTGIIINGDDFYGIRGRCCDTVTVFIIIRI